MNVLLIQNSVSVVRIPIYNYIADQFRFTIVYSEKSFPKEANFQYVKETRFKLCKICIYRHLFRLIKRCTKSDVVIIPLIPSYSNYLFLKMLKKKSRVITWGIGVPADYNTRYDKGNCRIVKRFLKIINESDASIFYCSYPRNKYAQLGVDCQKLFVANNTAPVKKMDFSENRNSILFIGTLYPQKKVYEILEYYYKLLKEGVVLPVFNIIGEGSERERLVSFILEHNLDMHVKMIGSIYDDDTLCDYFRDAIVCVSPDQAGLSVLKSMGYGVAFVTKSDALTGGELFNIIDGSTGVLVDGLEVFEEVLRDVAINKNKYIEIGRNAYNYYWNERRPEQMAQGFIDAIEYVVSKEDF